MDVSAIRLRNLQFLVDQLEGPAHARRRRKDVAVDLDMSASYLSQLIGGKKMGDDVARKIEAARQLPHGWMDQPQWPVFESRVHEPDIQPYSASHVLGIGPEILAAAHQLVRKACAVLEVEFDPETTEDAEIVLLGCSYLHARRESIVTVDNVVDFTKLMRKHKGDKLNVTAGSGSVRSAGAGTRA